MAQVGVTGEGDHDSYVVRDLRRGTATLLRAAVGPVLVLVVVWFGEFGWFGWTLFAVGVLAAVRATWLASLVLRMDREGITLNGRHSAWSDVAVVAAVEEEVAVERRHGAPLPPWERSAVSEPGRGVAYRARVGGLDPVRLARLLETLPRARHVETHLP